MRSKRPRSMRPSSSGSSFPGIDDPPIALLFSQFRTEKWNPLFLELLQTSTTQRAVHMPSASRETSSAVNVAPLGSQAGAWRATSTGSPHSSPARLSPSIRYLVAAEQHLPHRHFVDDGVQPVDEQEIEVGAPAGDGHADRRADLGVGDDGGERQGGVLEGLGHGSAAPAHADVGVVGKVGPRRRRRSVVR